MAAAGLPTRRYSRFPRSLVHCCCRGHCGSRSELFRKVVEFTRALGPVAGMKSRTALGLELGNGSRILSLPGQEGTIRSFSGVRLLIIDEAARVPTALYKAVRPDAGRVSGGRLICLSTSL